MSSACPVRASSSPSATTTRKRLYQSFNKLFPDYQRRGLAEIIDSHMERAEETLDDFKFKDMPRIAIAVDMLDTGIDVPAIMSLMFAKPIFSRVKFWQMIGRGTRLYEDPRTGDRKTDFLVIDCWNNFEYFQLNAEGETERPTEPLPVRLFRLLLRKQSPAAGCSSPGSTDRQGPTGHDRPYSAGQHQCSSVPGGDREADATVAGAGA